MLLSSQNILKLISREIKANFFKNMNDVMINKHDELKYLILTKENFRNYKIKTNYFQKWKKLSAINGNLIRDFDEFDINNKYNYNLFKSMNSLSIYPKLNSINFKQRKYSIHRYNNEDDINNISNDIVLNPKTNNLSICNINNIAQNNLKFCKNIDLYFLTDSNIKKVKNISEKDKLNLEIRKLDNFIFKCEKKEFQINNFEIKFLRSKIDDKNIDLYTSKTNNLLNIFKITKNIQFKIINKHSEKNPKMNIIENGLKNGQNIIQNNFETNENNNNKFPRNNNIKNNKNNKKNEDNEHLGNNTYMKNLLLIITIIFIAALILNHINIYYFEIL